MTIEESVGQAIATRVKAITGPGVKQSFFLVNPAVSVRKNGYQNTIADEVSNDPGVNNGKSDSIPASFGPTHRVLVIWDDENWMQDNGVITKLEQAANVEFIYSFGAQIPVLFDIDGNPEEIIPDFELTSTEDIDLLKEHETLQIFTRRKVGV